MVHLLFGPSQLQREKHRLIHLITLGNGSSPFKLSWDCWGPRGPTGAHGGSTLERRPSTSNHPHAWPQTSLWPQDCYSQGNGSVGKCAGTCGSRQHRSNRWKAGDFGMLAPVHRPRKPSGEEPGKAEQGRLESEGPGVPLDRGANSAHLCKRKHLVDSHRHASGTAPW